MFKSLLFSVRLKTVLFAGGALLLVSACANEPIQVEASRKVQAAVGQSLQTYGKNEYSPWGFGVCYGSQLNTPQEVLEFAQEICGTGRLEPRAEDLLWNGCPMFQGAKVSFVCYPKGPKRSSVGS
ncbi:hypothetical protein [Kiloniella laminariae]|uniref:hypothetical protein n=1 Tax=Kiloniella laminariae TaxID=454162 RepID=UPI0012F85B24|nr:hypothetical protein [Kiloniella laminariae]